MNSNELKNKINNTQHLDTVPYEGIYISKQPPNTYASTKL